MSDVSRLGKYAMKGFVTTIAFIYASWEVTIRKSGLGAKHRFDLRVNGRAAPFSILFEIHPATKKFI